MTSDPTDLGAIVFRWRRAVYVLALIGMLIFAAIASEPRAVGGAALFTLAWVVGSGLRRAGPRMVLLADLGVSVGLWWLYGPISGAAFVALGVVAIAPFLLSRAESRLLLVVALGITPVRVGLHFAADRVSLPLFHPHGPVPTSEFLTGEMIQALLLLGIGALMIRIAAMLRRGQEALAADLDRQRELNSLKDRFVATVSHELRTPLTSLKGFTTTLLEGDHDSREQREFLTIMAEQAEELHALIEDLIMFSRLAAGGLTLKTAEVDLQGLVDAVVSGFGTRSESVSNQVAAGTIVVADAPRLRQIVRNLVDNALKYGEPPVVVTAVAEDRLVRCSVIDSGAGVDPQSAELVFEPYTRLVDDDSMSRPGVGLGLPIVKELVEAHGGQVQTLTEGAMAGFEFTLPTAPKTGSHASVEANLLAT